MHIYELLNALVCLWHRLTQSTSYTVTKPKYHKLLYIQTSFSFLIDQHTPVNSQCPAAVASFPSNTVNYWTKVSTKKLLDADDITASTRAKITKLFLLPHFACILVWLFWMYKTIIGFGLCMILRIIQTSLNVIHLSLWLRQITLTSVWIIPDIMLSFIQWLCVVSTTLHNI